MPKRIQQRRTKGWRKPEGAVAVGRGTRWGNPYRITTVPEHEGYEIRSPRLGHILGVHETYTEAAEQAVYLYQINVVDRWEPATHDAARMVLGKRDLMCWCPTEDAEGNRVPCHADVLLELANPPSEEA